jgi:hypothetical protein
VIMVLLRHRLRTCSPVVRYAGACQIVAHTAGAKGGDGSLRAVPTS